MTYRITIFNVDGTVETMMQPKKPEYDQLSRAVGGYIETVPHMTTYDGLTRGVAYCNEEGKLRGLPFNQKATEAWLACLGNGPFRYEPRLHGKVIFCAKEK